MKSSNNNYTNGTSLEEQSSNIRKEFITRNVSFNDLDNETVL